jgi:hypothetical protein
VYVFAYGLKNLLAPLYALQIAQQVLVNNGFEIFDAVQPGKVTMAGNHYGAGVMVTVVAMDCEGGAAIVINSFTPNQASVESARTMLDAVLTAVQQG